MNGKILLITIFLLFSMILSACGSAVGGNSTNTDGKSEATSEVTTEKGSDSATTSQNGSVTTEEKSENLTTEANGNTDSATTEEKSESETDEETCVPPVIDPAMPDAEDAVVSYVAGDGMALLQFENMSETDFIAACDYLVNDGFSEYSIDNIGTSLSATYTKDDEYYTLLFAQKSGTFYIGHCESGAQNLPTQGGEYVAVCETTVTQGYSQNINGMTYIIRLADNSFIVVDGGYVEDAKNLIKTLMSLSGQESGIRIRAWLFSHAHDDHYPAFGEFASEYADKVALECVMFGAVREEAAKDKYFNVGIYEDIAKFEGAKAVPVHAGMTFRFADVTLEILNTPEYVYKDSEDRDFNESSSVYRVKNDDGSIIFLGDGYSAVSNFLINTYGEGLKTEMMQVSHHGVEQATIELYDMIAPSLAFWPCDEWLLAHERGTTKKQYLLQNENIYEHIIHGYGNATRAFSYRAEKRQTLQVISDDLSIRGSSSVANARVEDGVIKYEVVDTTDPYIWFRTKISTEDYNAIKIVVKAKNSIELAQSYLLYTCANEAASGFTSNRTDYLGPQGVSENGYYTLIVFLGNSANYTGDIKSLRFDIGVRPGQVVEIHSIEMFYLEIDK